MQEIQRGHAWQGVGRGWGGGRVQIDWLSFITQGRIVKYNRLLSDNSSLIHFFFKQTVNHNYEYFFKYELKKF